MELEALTALNDAQANLTEAEQRLMNFGFGVADREHWGVLTIGTGLGNARFTDRRMDAGAEGARVSRIGKSNEQ